jgi:hypothetical protein
MNLESRDRVTTLFLDALFQDDLSSGIGQNEAHLQRGPSKRVAVELPEGLWRELNQPEPREV